MKKQCEVCLTMRRRLIMYKDRYMCYRCYHKLTTRIPGHTKSKNIEDAQKEIRTVRSYENTNSHQVNVPSCYRGKKVRVIVVE